MRVRSIRGCKAKLYVRGCFTPPTLRTSLLNRPQLPLGQFGCTKKRKQTPFGKNTAKLKSRRFRVHVGIRTRSDINILREITSTTGRPPVLRWVGVICALFFHMRAHSVADETKAVATCT